MNPESRLTTVLEAARAASDYLRSALWVDHAVTAKGAYDLALAADTEAGKRILAVIEARFPGEFVLEEDGASDPGDGEWLWIVDPLDGTVNYHHRLPWFCVSVACYHRTESSDHPLWRLGRPVASAVLAPALGLEFWALEGRGAWSGTRRLRVSPEGLGSSLLSYSRGSRDEDQEFMRTFLDRWGPAARKTRSHGAAALDLAHVAQGSLGGHVQRSLSPWDVAAGAHLVLEAGGVFHASPGPGETHHVLAAGPRIAEVLEKEWPCAL